MHENISNLLPSLRSYSTIDQDESSYEDVSKVINNYKINELKYRTIVLRYACDILIRGSELLEP